jgi:hypothetical protein
MYSSSALSSDPRPKSTTARQIMRMKRGLYAETGAATARRERAERSDGDCAGSWASSDNGHFGGKLDLVF